MSRAVPPKVVFLDLLMATMDSMSTWSAAAGSREIGLAWRDAVTARMVKASRYVPYENLVARAAAELSLPVNAPRRLWREWERMEPWPDASAVGSLAIPYAFVTNCSTTLAARAVQRSGLRPVLTLAAEEAGWYKPRPQIYRTACARLGVSPAEAQFVAGAAYDAAGASAAGLSAALVDRRASGQPVAAGISVFATIGEALGGV